MFSRLVLVSLAAVMTLSGCSYLLNEGLPPQSEIDAKLGGGTQCLSEVLPTMANFMDGTARPAEVDAIWECFASAIDLFQKNTRGRYEDRFLSRELANFFERYFLKNTKLSDALLTEIFHLKQLFVGGSVEFMTRDELTKLSDFARLMKRVSIHLLPYMKVISLKWTLTGNRNFNEDVRTFEAANIEIQRAAKEIGSAIAKNGNGYRLSNIIVLLEEVSKLYSGDWTWLNDVRKLMPLVQKLKKSLAGGDEEIVSASEWTRFTLLGARGYVQYMRYHYFIENKEIVGGGPELIYIARSIDDLFSYLGDMVGEKPGAILTRAELLELMQAIAQFFPQLHPSDAFLLEVMKLKQIFFGGSLDNWKKEDFDLARTKVDAFRVLTERFLSYVSVYGLSWDPHEVPDADAQNYFQLAESNIIEFGRRLGTIMDTPYNLNDLLRFAEEWDKLIETPATKGKPIAPTIKPLVPVIVAVKNIVFSDKDPVVGQYPGQWSDFLKVAAQGYSRYMYYHYFLRKISLFESASLSALEKMVRQTADMLDGLIDRKPANPESVISWSELGQLIQAGFTAKFFPAKLKQETLEELLHIVLKKILISPERRLAGPPIHGLGKEVTLVLRREFATWFENQRFLEVIYSGLGPDARKTPEEILSDIGQGTVTEALTELKMALVTPVPLANNSQHRLVLGYHPLDYDQKSASLVNLSRSVSRLLIRSYASKMEQITSYLGITKDEANALFLDIKPIATQLGILNPKEVKFANSRFRDGNYLTPRANGDGYLNFGETVDLILFIVSGLEVDADVTKDLGKSCDIQKAEYKEDSLVEFNCALNFYNANVDRAYASMPDFLSLLRGMPAPKQRDYLVAMFGTSGYELTADNRMRLGDLSMVPHATQYIEGVYRRYDKDQDGYLNTQEALSAYPTFKSLLEELAKGKIKGDTLLKAVFTYLLYYEEVPSSVGDYLKLIFIWLPKGEDGWKVKANRMTLSKILAAISAPPKTNKDLNLDDILSLKSIEEAKKRYPEWNPNTPEPVH